MSFSEDLWDGFPPVSKWEQQGIAMCKAICRFYRKRAKVEESYGKSLFKLIQQVTEEIQQPGSAYCNDTICYGTLGSGWVATCHNAQVEAELHLNFAEHIRESIVETLHVNTLQLEDQLKQVVRDGERLLVDQEQWLSTIKKSKQAYYKAVKEAEAAKSIFDEAIVESKSFSAKAERRVNKAGQEAQTAEITYLGQIKHANNFSNSLCTELMPRVMKRLEDISRSRQQLLLHHFKEHSRLFQEMPDGLLAAGNALSKAVSVVEVQKDIQDFIKFNKSQQQKPAPFQYEPPSEDLSSSFDSNNKKSMNFFTLARKINHNIFGTHTSKGNPGSPPSLSPSSSTSLVERPFKFPVFGRSLDEIMACQREVLPDGDVPYFLLVLSLDIFKANAMCLEGVFRTPAPLHEIETLCKQFDSGNYDLSAVQSPYTTTHMIKKWCRDLPDPLIPSYLYERCLACNTKEEAKEVLTMIPPLYNKLVIFLIHLLHEFSLPACSAQSKMNSANLAMVFTPSFLRCDSTEMADFLLNVHREKNFVQFLIDGAEDKVTTEIIEAMMGPADEIVYGKDDKWQLSKHNVLPIQANRIDMLKDDFKSELQRQASEREMIQVKQQQLRRLTTKEESNDPKVLQRLLQDERAEKEHFQDSLTLKDKTIKVMRTELSSTVQEKLKLENAVKALQLRIDRLEKFERNDLTDDSNWEIDSLSGSGEYLPSKSGKVRENIKNFELKTRSSRSGSMDTGVDRYRNSAVFSLQNMHIVPRSGNLKEDKRNTIHIGELFNRMDADSIAPFKLPSQTSPPLPLASSNKIEPLLLSPVMEDKSLSHSDHFRSLSPAAPLSPLSSSQTSPRRDGSPSRKSSLSSPRGVSFRDFNTAQENADREKTTTFTVSSFSSSPSLSSTPPDFSPPRVPRIRLAALTSSSSDPSMSPRSTARHTVQMTVSPRALSSFSVFSTSPDINSPRQARHPALPSELPPLSPPGLGPKKSKLASSAEYFTRTVSYAGLVKKKNLSNSSPPSVNSTPTKGEKEKDGKKKGKHAGNNIEDQRIFDLINTNIQKYDALTKKETPPPSPKTQSFPHKLRLLIHKQPKQSTDNSKQLASPLASPPLSSPSSFSAVSSPPSTSPTEKSPRSPYNSSRPKNPRNKPYTPPSNNVTPLSPISPPHSPLPTPSSFVLSPSLSPRAHVSQETTDDTSTSPYANRRALSFPTPRTQSAPIGSPTATSSPQTSPRPTRSQTFLLNSAASAQDLHNLALACDRMKKETYKRLVGCIEVIGLTTDYTQTIEISKSIRLLIKCLDMALSKLGVDERQMRQLGTGKSSLPEMKLLAAEDGRLKKLRDILSISLDKIVDQIRCLTNVVSQITLQDEVNVITQTLGEMQLFFSKQDQTITKIGPQEVVDEIKLKIENTKATWTSMSIDHQVELAKVVLDVKKDIDEFCASNQITVEPTQNSAMPNSDADTCQNEERITRSILSTLDKIYAVCLVILQHSQNRNIRQSSDTSLDEAVYTEKFLEIFKALSIK